MKIRFSLCEPARVLLHLNDGYTLISLVRTEGLGLADGGVTWEIPTAAIPFPLRGFAARFLVVRPRFTPEDHDSPDDIRRLRDAVEVHELTGQYGQANLSAIST